VLFRRTAARYDECEAQPILDAAKVGGRPRA
jgi:hypothetical protein